MTCLLRRSRTRSRTRERRCPPAARHGTLDEDDLDRRLAEHAGRVGLLAVAGASNVTGVVQPVHRLAEKVHAVGGLILMDAAQLAGHGAIDMRAHDDPGHLDLVALSAHKMYAPFGTGALIGRRDAFASTPDHSGGGTIYAVTVDDVAWADLPHREEAGSPNVVGAVALGAAVETLVRLGIDRIAAHEAWLTHYATARLEQVPGLTIHGPRGVDAAPRLGVISFTIAGFDHGLVAAVLGYEHGVGVRSGCFCAQPYIIHLLHVGRMEANRWKDRARQSDIRAMPGMVRLSLGCYNNPADVDRAVDALERLVCGDIQGSYCQDDEGAYAPAGYVEPLLTTLTGSGAEMADVAQAARANGGGKAWAR